MVSPQLKRLFNDPPFFLGLCVKYSVVGGMNLLRILVVRITLTGVVHPQFDTKRADQMDGKMGLVFATHKHGF